MPAASNLAWTTSEAVLGFRHVQDEHTDEPRSSPTPFTGKPPERPSLTVEHAEMFRHYTSWWEWMLFKAADQNVVRLFETAVAR